DVQMLWSQGVRQRDGLGLIARQNQSAELLQRRESKFAAAKDGELLLDFGGDRVQQRRGPGGGQGRSGRRLRLGGGGGAAAVRPRRSPAEPSRPPARSLRSAPRWNRCPRRRRRTS